MTIGTRPLPFLLALAILAGRDDETVVPEVTLVATVRTDYAPGEERALSASEGVVAETSCLSEFVLFSPQHEHGEVLEHVERKLES